DAPMLLAILIAATTFDAHAAERFANLALACVHKEYPNKISHTLNSDADVAPPRKLTPAFSGEPPRCSLHLKGAAKRWETLLHFLPNNHPSLDIRLIIRRCFVRKDQPIVF